MSLGEAAQAELGCADGLASPSTDPTELFDLAEGMHAIEALTACVAWLGLPHWLQGHPATPQQLSSALGVALRPAQVLLTLLSSLGVVTRDPQGVYSLTQLGREHLLPDSPWSLVPCFDALKDRPTCLEMLAVLRTGKPLGAGDENSGPPPWAAGMGEEAFAAYFLNAIDSRNAYLSHALAERADLRGFHRLLDVGGGSGIYACALAHSTEGLEAAVLEKPPVDAVARRAIERRGLADRVSVLAGDMLAGPLPAGFDVHLYSNVLHDWEETTILQMLRSSFEALPPGGRLLIHDALLKENGKGSRPVASYSVLLMAFTSGRCYSVDEITSLVSQAGFVEILCTPTVVHRSLLTASKPSRPPRVRRRPADRSTPPTT